MGQAPTHLPNSCHTHQTCWPVALLSSFKPCQDPYDCLTHHVPSVRMFVTCMQKYGPFGVAGSKGSCHRVAEPTAHCLGGHN